MGSLLAVRAERPAADSVLQARAFEALRPLAPFKTRFVLAVGRNVYVLDAAWPDRRVPAGIGAGRTGSPPVPPSTGSDAN
jgi:hypothetical protein